MKKLIVLLIASLLLAFTLSSCSYAALPISCDDVIDAYEDAGYTVWHENKGADGVVCVMKAYRDSEDDYIYFTFFESDEEAESYAEDRAFNGILYFFTVIFGDAQWIKTKTYGNIEYEYENSDLAKPFNDLVGK